MEIDNNEVEEEVESEFEENNSNAIEYAYNMRKFLDIEDINKVIESAIQMLNVLRNTNMTIPQYISICNSPFYIDNYITSNLNFLETLFMEEQKKGKKMLKLYNEVQETRQVLPRLYLLIMVGCCTVNAGEI